MKQAIIGILIATVAGCSPKGTQQRDESSLQELNRQMEESEAALGRLVDDHQARPAPAPRTTRRTQRVNQREVRTQPRAVRPVRRAAPQVPCYLDEPSHIASGDLVRIINKMQHPLGLRVNGKTLTVIGAQALNGTPLPNGVATAHGLLPAGHMCWHPLERAGALRIDAIQFRQSPYPPYKPQQMAKTWKRIKPRFPRTDNIRVGFSKYNWRIH